MEYKPAVYNIGRDVVKSLQLGHTNKAPTLNVLQLMQGQIVGFVHG